MSSRESSLSLTPSCTPVSSGHIPKYGTLIANRIFVGGLPADTNETDLKQFFAVYGAVKDCKIIVDRGGISKSYGFVTFENHEDAERIMRKEADSLIFKDRKLNVGPAIRKQQAYPKTFDQCRSPSSAGSLQYRSSVPYIIPAVSSNPVTVYCSPDGCIIPSAQPQGLNYPVMISMPSYCAQPPAQYHHQSPVLASPLQWGSGGGQWRWAVQQGSPGGAPVIPASPYGYPVHQVLPADVPLSQPMGEASLANAAVMMQPGCIEPLQYYSGPQFPNTAMC